MIYLALRTRLAVRGAVAAAGDLAGVGRGRRSSERRLIGAGLNNGCLA